MVLWRGLQLCQVWPTSLLWPYASVAYNRGPPMSLLMQHLCLGAVTYKPCLSPRASDSWRVVHLCAGQVLNDTFNAHREYAVVPIVDILVLSWLYVMSSGCCCCCCCLRWAVVRLICFKLVPPDDDGPAMYELPIQLFAAEFNIAAFLQCHTC